MTLKPLYKISLVFIFSIFYSGSALSQNVKPNIVLIYVDDLGYGDIGVNGAVGVNTPNVDKLAQSGVNFTDAHSSSSTCTPSRYSLLTGSHAFRNNAAILSGDAPLIIDVEMETMPKMLQKAGYHTGIVGKWHLGLGDGNVDWNEEVKPGPREVGFDYSFLIPATGDRIPTVFMENQRVINLDPYDPIEVSYGSRLDGYPLGSERPELLKQHADPMHLQSITNGFSRIGYMNGGESALWVDEEFPFILTEKAVDFMKAQKDNPFFLFFSLHDIHQPRVANVEFVRKSLMGPRGDVIAQMDWCVGEITKTLEKLEITENTLLIFTSDNGPILDDGYFDYARELVGSHLPAGPYKGTKYSIYEGGTRMPTIVSWPGTVDPGENSALISQTDFYASLAKLVGQPIEKGNAVDSGEFLDVLLNKSEKGREYLLEEAYVYGIRHHNWKFIPAKNVNVPEWLRIKYVDPGFFPEPQLFDLSIDPFESNNLANKYPDKVKEMESKLNAIVKGEFSTK
ncbi:MAG: arylsulfatase [Mongoliibacter sp.]|uniref:sulfatase family protein n=1 Tax=Mongoliibacter sp. TaxID=2022438 RepID=UPI0012F4211A|nr:arylsulfatase [Mongoliibacter sp.]TVP53349.1 MAG: arylsulfatase [Mongoliibacter sp.]